MFTHTSFHKKKKKKTIIIILRNFILPSNKDIAYFLTINFNQTCRVWIPRDHFHTWRCV